MFTGSIYDRQKSLKPAGGQKVATDSDELIENIFAFFQMVILWGRVGMRSEAWQRLAARR